MTQYTKTQWMDKIKNIELKNRAFINGAYMESSDAGTYEVLNPATGKKLADVTACTQQDVDLAVKVARNTFNSGCWSDKSPRERKQVIKKLADLILQNCEELALLETLNVGKPISDSFNLDIPGAAGCFEWYAEAVDKIYGEVAPTDGNNVAMITREPIGVVAAIIPWNFPLDIAAWKLAPALISGNSVILKPAEQSPHTALRLAELAIEAGLPDGVLNVVTGTGEVVGQALGRHNDIDCLTFTGSTATAKRLMSYSAESNMKPVWPETGGKSPNIIFSNCDLDAAVKHAAAGIFFNQGEVCSANSRILVERSIQEAFTEKLIEHTKQMKQGDPLDPETQIGALISQGHADKVRKMVAQAKEAGAKSVCGYQPADQAGCFVEPTILTNVTPLMTIAQEEVFGPVVVIIPFDSKEQAIEIANDSIYGLAASVWTQNITCAHSVAKALRAGTVSINTMDALDYCTPFGGFKQSGFGRDLSLHAFDKFTQLKTTWIKLA